MPKLPRYVFRRANGSYRYKRNVPKALRQVIPKATVYRQLGESYDEAIRKLPIVHAEIEALFDQERATPNSVRAKSIVRERLGDRHTNMFADRVVDPEWDVMDDFVELADALEGSTPPEVIRQVGTASITPEPMTLLRVLDEYYAYKCEDGVENTPLKTRIERLRKDLIIALGKNRVEWTPLAEIGRADANTVRDYLLTRMAPNSALRTLGVIKAAINHVIIENDLEQRNVFQGIKIKGAGASKDDRLPMSDSHVATLLRTYETTPTAYALFVILCDTGARLAEIVGLEAQDIDLEACCLHIRPNSLRSLKTKTSDRTIPLSPRVRDDLRKHQGDARGTAPLPTVCPSKRKRCGLGHADEAAENPDQRQEDHHPLPASPHEGQAAQHRLSRGHLAGHPGPQHQHRRCQLWLRLCAGHHARAYGAGVGGVMLE